MSDALSGVAALVGQIDTGPTFPVAVDAAGSFSFATSLPLDGSADGTHTVHLVATDKAGNVSASYDDAFVLDTAPPAVTYTGPAAGAATRTNPTLTGKVSDVAERGGGAGGPGRRGSDLPRHLRPIHRRLQLPDRAGAGRHGRRRARGALRH